VAPPCRHLLLSYPHLFNQIAAGAATHQRTGLEFLAGAVVVSNRQSDHVAARNYIQITYVLLQPHQHRRCIFQVAQQAKGDQQIALAPYPCMVWNRIPQLAQPTRPGQLGDA